MEPTPASRVTRGCFVPHGKGHAPAEARVPAYTVRERSGIVWVWMGTSEAADESLLPDYGAIDADRCHVARGYLHVKTNYVLESDNILDLSHIQFLHAGSLGSNSVASATPKVVQSGNSIWSHRFIGGDTLPPFLENMFRLPPGFHADRWLDVRWDPPASLLLIISIGVSGTPREEVTTILNPHIFTPETESTTHYWFASCFERERHPDGDQRARQLESASFFADDF